MKLVIIGSNANSYHEFFQLLISAGKYYNSNSNSKVRTKVNLQIVNSPWCERSSERAL